MVADAGESIVEEFRMLVPFTKRLTLPPVFRVNVVTSLNLGRTNPDQRMLNKL